MSKFSDNFCISYQLSTLYMRWILSFYTFKAFQEELTAIRIFYVLVEHDAKLLEDLQNLASESKKSKWPLAIFLPFNIFYS